MFYDIYKPIAVANLGYLFFLYCYSDDLTHVVISGNRPSASFPNDLQQVRVSSRRKNNETYLWSN